MQKAWSAVLGLLLLVGCDTSTRPCVDGWRVGEVDRQGMVKDSQRLMQFEVGCTRQVDNLEGDTEQDLRPVETFVRNYDIHNRLRRTITRNAAGTVVVYRLPDEGRQGTDDNGDGCVDRWEDVEPEPPVDSAARVAGQTDPRATITPDQPTPIRQQSNCVEETDLNGILVYQRCPYGQNGNIVSERTLTSRGVTWVVTYDGDGDGVPEVRQETWMDATGDTNTLEDANKDGVFETWAVRGQTNSSRYTDRDGDSAWDSLTRQHVVFTFTPDTFWPLTQQNTTLDYRPVTALQHISRSITTEDREACMWSW